MRRRARIATSAACGVAAALLAMGGVQSARADVQRERSELLERYGTYAISTSTKSIYQTVRLTIRPPIPNRNKSGAY